MTSDKQIKANKQNALKGGVKTDAGKSISRLNATKFGFFSKITTEFDKISNEDFCTEMYNYYQPENEYEKQLVEIILSNFLTYRRICFVEKEFIETKVNPDVSHCDIVCDDLFLTKGYKSVIKLDLLDDLNKFQKYKTSIQNNIVKLSHELERLTNNRNSKNKIIPNAVI